MDCSCLIRLTRMAIALSLLSICFCCYSDSFPSTVFTLMALALSTFRFFVTKIKQLCKSNSMDKPQELDQFDSKVLPEAESFEEKKVIQDEGDNYNINGLVLRQTNRVEEEHDKRSMSSSISDDEALREHSGLTYNSFQSESESSSCSTSDDTVSQKNLSQSKESSECSISDDEGLIEIELSDGHCVAPKDSDEFFFQLPTKMKTGFLQDFLPETVFRHYGLMELLSEINEEDNLIEIDITRGSIKCSRSSMEVKA